MRNFIFILSTTLLLLFSVSCSDKKTTEYKSDQVAFSNSLAMLLKANADAYIIIDEYKKTGQNPYQAEKYIQDLTKTYKEIIIESKNVSDEFLDYADTHLKHRYRNLISIYSTIIDMIQNGNYNEVTVKEIHQKNYKAEEEFWNLFSEKQSTIFNKFSGFEQDWNEALSKHNVPVEKQSLKENNKSYWKMLLKLFLGSLVLALVYVIFGFICLIILKLLINNKKEISKKVLGFGILAHIFQLYIWLLWVSFCVFSLKYYIDSPFVTQSWLYYVTGFIASVFLISMFAEAFKGMKETAYLNVIEKMQILIIGPSTSIILIIISFILFIIFPHWMNLNFVSFINNWIY